MKTAQFFSDTVSPSSRKVAYAAIALFVVAAAFRFAAIGRWSLAGDEVFTFQEIRSLFGDESIDVSSQIYRLPRLLPVAYGLTSLGTWLFGETEIGGRIPSAVLGTIIVPLIFLFVRRVLGFRAALIGSLMVAVWPTHIFHSQEVRFYSAAAFFGWLSYLLGACALARKSNVALAGSFTSTFLGLFCHTPVFFIGIGVPVAIWLLRERQRFPGLFYWLNFFFAAALCLTLFFHIRPLLQGWNSGADWGRDSVGALLGLVNSIGLHTVLLAAIGTAFALGTANPDIRYWLLGIAGLVAVVAVLPFVSVFHGAYAFAFMLPVFVVAGYGAVAAADAVHARTRLGAVVWIVGIFALGAPQLVSYYADGNRTDMRAAAQFIARHWQPGDVVATVFGNIFRHYQPEKKDVVWIQPNLSAVEKITAAGGNEKRIWVIVDTLSRRGIDHALKEWLFQHGRLAYQVRPFRLDYFQPETSVYLIER